MLEVSVDGFAGAQSTRGDEMPKSSNAVYKAVYLAAMTKTPLVIEDRGTVYAGYGLEKTDMMRLFFNAGWQPDDRHRRWRDTIDTWAKIGLVKRVGDVTFVYAGERATEMAVKFEDWWWKSQDERIMAIRAETGPGTRVETVI